MSYDPKKNISSPKAGFNWLSLVAEWLSGCTLEFLPPYRPDLNSIEHKWAQAKVIKEQYRCCVDELFSVYMRCDKLF